MAVGILSIVKSKKECNTTALVMGIIAIVISLLPLIFNATLPVVIATF